MQASRNSRSGQSKKVMPNRSVKREDKKVKDTGLPLDSVIMGCSPSVGLSQLAFVPVALPEPGTLEYVSYDRELGTVCPLSRLFNLSFEEKEGGVVSLELSMVQESIQGDRNYAKVGAFFSSLFRAPEFENFGMTFDEAILYYLSVIRDQLILCSGIDLAGYDGSASNLDQIRNVMFPEHPVEWKAFIRACMGSDPDLPAYFYGGGRSDYHHVTEGVSHGKFGPIGNFGPYRVAIGGADFVSKASDGMKYPRRAVNYSPDNRPIVVYKNGFFGPLQYEARRVLALMKPEAKHTWSPVMHGYSNHIILYPSAPVCQLALLDTSIPVDSLTLDIFVMLLRVLSKAITHGQVPVYDSVLDVGPYEELLRHVRKLQGDAFYIGMSALDWLAMLYGLGYIPNAFVKGARDAGVGYVGQPLWQYWLANRWMLELDVSIGSFVRLGQVAKTEITNPMWGKMPVLLEKYQQMAVAREGDLSPLSLGLIVEGSPGMDILRFLTGGRRYGVRETQGKKGLQPIVVTDLPAAPASLFPESFSNMEVIANETGSGRIRAVKAFWMRLGMVDISKTQIQQVAARVVSGKVTPPVASPSVGLFAKMGMRSPVTSILGSPRPAMKASPVTTSLTPGRLGQAKHSAIVIKAQANGKNQAVRTASEHGSESEEWGLSSEDDDPTADWMFKDSVDGEVTAIEQQPSDVQPISRSNSSDSFIQIGTPVDDDECVLIHRSASGGSTPTERKSPQPLVERGFLTSGSKTPPLGLNALMSKVTQ